MFARQGVFNDGDSFDQGRANVDSGLADEVIKYRTKVSDLL